MRKVHFSSFSWSRESFSFSSHKQGHEMPKALQKQKPHRQCMFHRQHFQPALSSAHQMQPPQHAESKCQSAGCPQHVNCLHGSFSTLFNFSASVSFSILKTVVSIHRPKSSGSLLIFWSYAHTYSPHSQEKGFYLPLAVP